MNTFDLVQWQLWDEETQSVLPWLTHPFLEVLKTWDLSEKRVLEMGGGRSSKYWRKKAKWVTTVETNKEWGESIVEECRGLTNGVVLYVNINEGDQKNAAIYTSAGDDFGPYDIIVIDGILRHNCLEKALTMKRPLIVIHDNWQQDGFLCLASEEIMIPYETHNFIQEDHTDNHGRKWATAYWELK